MTKGVARAVMVSVLPLCMSVSAAFAQEMSAPAELPPETYAGTQYVDSRGCAYVRATVSGGVVWRPRVSQGRQQLCGFVPTVSMPSTAVPVEPQSPAVVPPPTASPDIVPETQPPEVSAVEVVAAPSPAAQPAPSDVETDSSATTVPDTVDGDEDTTAAAPTGTNATDVPPAAAAPVPTAAPAAPRPRRSDQTPRQPPPRMTQAAACAVARAERIAVVDAATGQPVICAEAAALAGGQPHHVVVASPTSAGTARLRYVQVATFADMGNADATLTRLQATGLPVGISDVRQNGRELRIVLAGPFVTQGDLQRGLLEAREMGFADAFARR